MKTLRVEILALFAALLVSAQAAERWAVIDHFQPNFDGLYTISGDVRPQGANAWYEPEIDMLSHDNWYVRENYLASRYRIPFRPINPNLVFKTPPVGWMTWYAVKFRASDEVVMHNARRFMEVFRGYTDEKPVLWVDWEWFHGRFSENGDETDTDMLTPRKEAYPRGMKPVADDLKQLGFTPALWVSVLNDTRTNALWKAHPEWVLGDRKAWCGPIYANPSAPGFCEEFVPHIFSLYKEWGYEAFKWDVVPASYFMIADRGARGAAVEPRPSAVSRRSAVREQFRRCVKAVRQAVGENCYVMSCSGEWEEPTLAAVDLFDGGRIGGDIFTWEEFRKAGVDRILSYQPFHNTVFWADADNLVLREEFSTLAQARTRVTIYALAGVPITMGDEIDALDEPRIDLLRRAMPVVKMRPASLSRGVPTGDLLPLRADFGRAFGAWSLRGWSNMTTNRTLSAELTVENSVVWDFWNDRLVSAEAGKRRLFVEVTPGDTVLYRVAKIEKNRPTLVSVSRHITQGGYEIVRFESDAKGVRGVVRCPGRETVKVTLLLPEGRRAVRGSCPLTQDGRIVRLAIDSAERADVAFSLELFHSHAE